MESSKKILLVEDDPEISNLVELHLKDQGWQTEAVADGTVGLERALTGEFDVVVLDLMLPGTDGLEICKRLRQENSLLPVLMLTSRSEEVDRVLGLELGADDYLTKPFSIRELIARIKALLRRLDQLAQVQDNGHRDEVLQFAGLTLDLSKRKVTLGAAKVELTAKEYELLALFARHPGRAYSRQDLLEIVWGYQYSGYDHTVNSHINRLRGKIEGDPAKPRYIKTVWGHGYRFAEREELES